MTFTVHDMPQRSPAWFQARVGRVTGSCAEPILAVRKDKKTGELARRADLRRTLVVERLTGLTCEDTFITYDMQRGMDLEAAAFFAYEVATGQGVQRCGFVSHDTIKAGCSPDGFIGAWQGILELKVPKSITHLEYLQAGILPETYRAQCLHALWLTGAQWCDFCSFDPRFPEHLELFRVRLERDEVEIQAYELLLTIFLREVDEAVAALQPVVTT